VASSAIGKGISPAVDVSFAGHGLSEIENPGRALCLARLPAAKYFCDAASAWTEAPVDSNYFTALAALSGSAIGGLTSFCGSWLSLRSQLKMQLRLDDKMRRQELYRIFVEEASRLFIDGLTRDTPELSKTIALYALISRMRVLSSQRVIEEAHKVARMIVESYAEPNLTFDDLRTMMNEDHLDPLRGFSQACRDELGPLVPA